MDNKVKWTIRSNGQSGQIDLTLIWHLWASHLFDICRLSHSFDFCGCQTYLIFVTVTLIWCLWLSHLLDVCDCHTYLMFLTVTVTWCLWLSHLFNIFGFHTYATFVGFTLYLTLWMSHLSDILGITIILHLCVCQTYLKIEVATPTFRWILPLDLS